MGLKERGYPNLGYVSLDTQNGSGTLLEAIGIVLETHFGFGSQMGLRQP